ncbi:hypothetical protein [Subtercola vilae]|uniref:Type II toxin-antitoxin system HicB family antitoxin n=1 Tax=Subtercola vilae TaxID=2056433 RepID=A0A4T2BSD5_9MICO|nr:hypothetical protein [Subtercola vilae]TIH32268.1 hypothetical protein D4765_15940 [Subtercola vilae]
MRRFDVFVFRDQRWWILEIPALGTISQAERYSDVPSTARDLIAIWLDAPAGTVPTPRIIRRTGPSM